MWVLYASENEVGECHVSHRKMVEPRFRRFAFVLDGVIADCVVVNDSFAAILSSSPEIVELLQGEVMPGWSWDGREFAPPSARLDTVE